MHGVSHLQRMCLEGNQQCYPYAAAAGDLHHLHGTGMGIWSPNDERTRVDMIRGEMRKESLSLGDCL
jgi:hypothetical protein